MRHKKREEQQKAFANLPPKAQEWLASRPTFFDGSSQEAEKWLENTREFASFNQMELFFAFDMLMSGNVKLLWQDFCQNRT